MALIKCSECGREISDKAEMCPSCGNPIRNMQVTTPKPVEIELTSKKWKKKGVWGVLFLVISLIVMANSTGLGIFLFFLTFCYGIYVVIGRWWTNG